MQLLKDFCFTKNDIVVFFFDQDAPNFFRFPLCTALEDPTMPDLEELLVSHVLEWSLGEGRKSYVPDGDVKQALNARAAITVSKDTTLRDYAQAKYQNPTSN